MKKRVVSKFFLAMMTASLLLSGCGAEETDGSVESSQVDVEQESTEQIEKEIEDVGVDLSVGEPDGIRVSEGAKYQYQVISPEDIIVEYSGLKSDVSLAEYEGSYVTDTSVYLSDTVGIYLGEEHFEAKVGEYVSYVDVDFKWSVSDEDLYLLARHQLEASPDLFMGSITYADGHVGSIEAEKVRLKNEGDILKVYIDYRGNDSVGYEIEIPEIWGDMNYSEVSQEEIEEWYEGLGGDSSEVDVSAMSSNATEIKENPWDGLYSVADAPGLTSIDWDAFNGYMFNEQMCFLGDVNLEINVLQVLGNDPRINHDWSELNDKFSALYGNGDEGLARFASDLARSYDYSVDFSRGFCKYAYLDIEPYRSNTDSGVYGEINELEVTDQAAYDAYYGAIEEEAREKVEQAEQDRWNSLTPEEQQAELYDKEMSTYWMTISNMSMDLYNKGIYTPEISDTFSSEYDLLDWLITNGHLADPDGKYKESVDWYISNK